MILYVKVDRMRIELHLRIASAACDPSHRAALVGPCDFLAPSWTELEFEALTSPALALTITCTTEPTIGVEPISPVYKTGASPLMLSRQGCRATNPMIDVWLMPSR